jgi:hypothetical protein
MLEIRIYTILKKCALITREIWTETGLFLGSFEDGEQDSEVSVGMKWLRQMSHFTIKNRVSAWDVKQVGENDGVPGLTAAQSLKDKKHNAEKAITWVKWILVL